MGGCGGQEGQGGAESGAVREWMGEFSSLDQAGFRGWLEPDIRGR